MLMLGMRLISVLIQVTDNPVNEEFLRFLLKNKLQKLEDVQVEQMLTCADS